jgi:phosphate uptake regulator/aminoglycoside phosphotransferase (APT) family kinase protein
MSDLDLLAIRDNLKKMGRLGAKQVQAALRAFENVDLAASDRVVEGDNVFDALNLSIEEKSYQVDFNKMAVEERRFVRSAVKVSSNLEHIGDAACHIARRVQIMSHDQTEFVDFDTAEMESIALAAIRESLDAYLTRDVKQAEWACLREPQLDAIYRVKIEAIKGRLKLEPDHVDGLLNWYSVIKYLEKICDYTLNIGELAIFLATGRRLKFAQYQQLDRLASHNSTEKIDFYPYYDGISGALVARMDNGEKQFVLKTGSRAKINAEASKLKEWEQIFPSLTPKVISTFIQGDRETLLREFVAGDLLSELYFSDRAIGEKEKATRSLMDILLELWALTLQQMAPGSDYTEQIRCRLGEVYAMHPYLEYYADNENIDDLLEKARTLEIRLKPAFSVWLHGDFNINNIIYHEGQIKFIDVHRSNYGDYLCDVGVFMISTIRHAPRDAAVMKDMERIRAIIREFIGNFAKEHGDCAFESRLQLSLARSYITSARVVIDEKQARSLFETGLGLLKKEVYL